MNTCKRIGSLPFKRDNIELTIPVQPGIYLFWSGLLCVYVGKATNLRSRLLSHWRKSHSEGINVWIRALGSNLCMSFEIVSGDLSVAEQKFIERFNPHLNKINARST